MNYSFIRKLQNINMALNTMCEHLEQTDSEFKYKVCMARDSLLSVEKTYHEVLERDANEDSTYIKPTIVENK